MQSVKDLAGQHPALASCVGGTAAVIALFAAKELLETLAVRVIFRDTPPKMDVQPGTVVVHQLGRGTRAPSLSPFPVKLETFLRLAKIPYVNDFSGTRSSKGKTPWITLDGVDVADSQLCIKYLKTKLNLNLNPGLTKEQLGAAQAIQVMVDEHLY